MRFNRITPWHYAVVAVIMVGWVIWEW